MINTSSKTFLTNHNHITQHKSSTHQTLHRINTCASTALHTPTRQHTSHQHISINTSNNIKMTTSTRHNLINAISTSEHQHISTSTLINTQKHHNISAFQHTNASTHQHISRSAHQHINTSTYQHINMSMH